METRVMFISTQNLKNDTILENNVEDYILKPCIYDAHIIDLQEVLGEKLYKDLVNKTLNNTLNSDEVTLINSYIYNFLIKASLYRCLPYLWAKIEHTSIVVKEDQNSKSIESKDLNIFRGEIKNDTSFLKERLIDYLINNVDKFPLYKDSNGCDENVLDPNKNNYGRIGIYL
jgi:hypothetical protein